MSAALWSRQETRARRVLDKRDYDRYLPLVRRTAMRIARKVPASITMADLLGYGWLGLLEAYSRCDPGMPEEEFEAYAVYRVRGAMLDHLRSLDPTTREMRSVSRRVAQAIKLLTKELGVAPDEKQIAKRLGMSENDYQNTLGKLAKAGMSRLELLDIDKVDLESDETTPEEAAASLEINAVVTTAIGTLPDKLQEVLALYYQEGCTLREIGMVLGVSESRVSQLHTEAVHRLRAAIGKE